MDVTVVFNHTDISQIICNKHFYHAFFFLLESQSYRQEGRESQERPECSSAGLLPTWPQQQELGQFKHRVRSFFWISQVGLGDQELMSSSPASPGALARS